MNNTFPLVSFVIPTHNRANVLRDCLESVVNQTYKNIEVIVINDNSKDQTDSILKEYKYKYKFFNYYNNVGVGGNAARNFGIQKAKGEYIAFMDDDDICELDRIQKQMKPILDTNYKYNFVASAFSVFNSAGEITSVVNYLKPMESLGFTARWLIKKDLIIEAGCFDIKQPALQDVEFFWRLKTNAKIFYVSKPLIRVRVSEVSITRDPQKMTKAIIRLLKLHKNKMSEKEVNIWLMQLCKILALNNNWIEYKEKMKKVNGLKNPIFVILLYLTLLLKDNRLLKLHSKIRFIFQKFFIKNFSKTRSFQYKPSK